MTQLQRNKSDCLWMVFVGSWQSLQPFIVSTVQPLCMQRDTFVIGFEHTQNVCSEVVVVQVGHWWRFVALYPCHGVYVDQYC